MSYPTTAPQLASYWCMVALGLSWFRSMVAKSICFRCTWLQVPHGRDMEGSVFRELITMLSKLWVSSCTDDFCTAGVLSSQLDTEQLGLGDQGLLWMTAVRPGPLDSKRNTSQRSLNPCHDVILTRLPASCIPKRPRLRNGRTETSTVSRCLATSENMTVSGAEKTYTGPEQDSSRIHWEHHWMT